MKKRNHLSCEICLKSFQSEKSLSFSHAKSVHEKEKFTCEICLEVIQSEEYVFIRSEMKYM